MNQVDETMIFDQDLKTSIQKNLIYLRKQSKGTTRSVAAVLKITRQGYSAYENGTREPNVATLKKLAAYYGVTLDLITSSNLVIYTSSTSVSYPAFIYDGEGYKRSEHMTSVRNTAFSIMLVQMSDKITKVFESNMNIVQNHECIFEFRGEIHIGKIYLLPSGDGTFLENGKMFSFSKKDINTKLIPIGMLLATIDKEYQNNDFF